MNENMEPLKAFQKNAEQKEEPIQPNPMSEDELQAMITLDRMDEKQIREQMAGRALEEYAYQFQMGSRTVTGLSFAGVMEVARNQGNIRMIDLQVEDKGDIYFAKCKGRDDKNGLEIFGVATQAKKMTTYKGEIDDPFAIIKAAGKAQRNVLRRLIPETAAKVYLEEALKKKRQKAADAKTFT